MAEETGHRKLIVFILYIFFFFGAVVIIISAILHYQRGTPTTNACRCEPAKIKHKKRSLEETS